MALTKPINVVAWCKDEIVRLTEELRLLERDPNTSADQIAGYKDILATLERVIAQHSN